MPSIAIDCCAAFDIYAFEIMEVVLSAWILGISKNRVAVAGLDTLEHVSNTSIIGVRSWSYGACRTGR